MTTRRKFLAAAAAAPAILGAQNRSGSKLPVIGAGERQYEVIHDWGQLPSHIKWGNTHAVLEDSNGFIYIHHTVHATSQSPDSVVVFDDYTRRLTDKGFTDPYDSLSEREREVLQLVAEGRSSKEIAEVLSISAATVETHRAHLLQKLGLHNTVEVVRYAARRGIVH